MKKQFVALVALATIGVQAQEYNKWSLDISGGVNKPLAEMSSGYYTSMPSFWTVDGGVRYMFNNKFGLRLGGGYDSYQNADSSKQFESSLWNINLQTYSNIGRVLGFETWTSDLGLLAHAGLGYGRLSSEYLGDNVDQVGFAVVGLTPQLRITDRVTFFGDASLYLNARQNRTFDTYSETVRRGIQGVKFTVTAGLSIALGSLPKHADWYYEGSKIKDIEENVAKLRNDLDALGQQVAENAAINDANGNGIPDEIEAYVSDNYMEKSFGEATQVDVATELIKNGYISVYFNFNSSNPQDSSAWASDFIVKYMKSNPSASITISGYADELGSVKYNQVLSAKRANAVRDLLINAGIDESRISAEGKGEDTSVNKNSSNARQIARRATFGLK